MMRFPGLVLLLFASATAVFAAPQTTTPAPQANQQSANANGVDSIIALVQANMSEGLVLKTIQRQNKAYDLTPDDLLKLQKAGVSERIINAMLDPSRCVRACHCAGRSAPAPLRHRRPLPRQHPRPREPLLVRVLLVQVHLIWPHPVQVGPAPVLRARQVRPTRRRDVLKPLRQQRRPRSQPAPKSGVFSSFKDRMKGTAQKTVDGFGDTMNCAVDKGVQTSESQVSSTADSAAAAPGQAVSSATKPVTTATTNATNSATAAQSAAKKSATK